MSPVEPSESMQTLEAGRVNAGFLFFCAAILSTLVFGRFFCGWGCHVVALQDLCAHFMKRAGIRPRAFRSRLLVGIPVGLAVYMFLWPTLRREWIAPWAARAWPGALPYLGEVHPFPGFTSHLTETEFWRTFPGVAVAVPFLLICGFAVVYFLGSKGFCTYGCPYGGIFGPVDRLAWGKIRVDHARCEGCAHCTATCTSNVRVHEEVREYGMVVDSGCMKCFDCVSVCPNGALSWGFGRPAWRKGAARFKKPQRSYDLGMGGELALGAVFLAAFFAVRGAYGAIPMLMAVGIGLCVMFLGWKSASLLARPTLSLHRTALKHHGKLRPAGAAFLALAGAAIAVTSQTGWVNYHRWQGDMHDLQVNASREAVLAGTREAVPAQALAHAERALAHYRRAAPRARGGDGLAETPGLAMREAWLELVCGRPAKAEPALRALLTKRGPDDELCADLASVLRLQGKHHEAVRMLEQAVGERPEFRRSRQALAVALLEGERYAEAAGQFRALVAVEPDRATLRHDLAVALYLGGESAAALIEMERAAALAPADQAIAADLARMRAGGD